MELQLVFHLSFLFPKKIFALGSLLSDVCTVLNGNTSEYSVRYRGNLLVQAWTGKG